MLSDAAELRFGLSTVASIGPKISLVHKVAVHCEGVKKGAIWDATGMDVLGTYRLQCVAARGTKTQSASQ